MKRRMLLVPAMTLVAAATCAAEGPLRDRSGAPACGNVGHAGARLAGPAMAALGPAALLSLVGAATAEAARPLLGPDGRPACGNVMGKRDPGRAKP